MATTTGVGFASTPLIFGTHSLRSHDTVIFSPSIRRLTLGTICSPISMPSKPIRAMAIALIGLLGMLIGEQIVPSVKRLMEGEKITVSWLRSECVPKISGVEAKPTPVVVAKAAKSTEDAA